MSFDAHAPIVIGPCRICGWRALTQDGLCVDCKEIAVWAGLNRRWCEGFHRRRWPTKAEIDAVA